MATNDTTLRDFGVSDDEQTTAAVRLSEIATLGPDVENLVDFAEYQAATDCVLATLRAQTEAEA